MYHLNINAFDVYSLCGQGGKYFFFSDLLRFDFKDVEICQKCLQLYLCKTKMTIRKYRK
jgi:hypothetical protein